jgi:hypothetical protein
MSSCQAQLILATSSITQDSSLFLKHKVRHLPSHVYSLVLQNCNSLLVTLPTHCSSASLSSLQTPSRPLALIMHGATNQMDTTLTYSLPVSLDGEDGGAGVG